MKLVPIFSGSRQYWLLTLIGVGVSIAIANITGVLLLKTLWQSSSFTHLVFGFVAIGILVFALSVLEAYCAEKLGQNYVKAIRCQLYQGLVGAPSYLAPKRVGVVMSRMITDSNQIKNWASIGIPKLTIHSISATGLTVFLCLNWGEIGWLATGFSIIYLLSMATLTPKMYQIALEIRRDRGRLSGFLGESIIASQTVNQFNLLNRETRRLARHNDRLAKSSVTQAFFTATSKHFSHLISQVMTLCVLVLFLWENTLPNQELAVVMLTLGLLFNSLKQLNTSWVYAITFYAAKLRLELALNNAAPRKPAKETKLTSKYSHAIQLKRVQLTEDSAPISQSIAPGSAIHIPISESSERLVEILSKHQLPISGRVTVSGRRLDWLSRQSVNKSIITLSRASYLLRGTMKSNLRVSEENLNFLHALLAHFELSEEHLNETISELGRNLTSLQYARLLVIQALLRQPGLLIISHPDICANSELMDKMLIWQEKVQFTLLVVGHVSSHLSERLQDIDIQELTSIKTEHTEPSFFTEMEKK